MTMINGGNDAYLSKYEKRPFRCKKCKLICTFMTEDGYCEGFCSTEDHNLVKVD